MNFIKNLFENLNLSFSWKGNKKKSVTQIGGGLQVQQEQNSITNIYNYRIDNLTVGKIEEISGIESHEDLNTLQKAGNRFLIEQNTRQENLKNIVDISKIREIENPKEVEKDWFLRWMEISQTVSIKRENVQKILAKILSNEVKEVGSFSLRVLDVLKNLSREELELFQKICDMSFSIPSIKDRNFAYLICEPYGNPGNNALLPVGLPYINLTKLQDAGLIQVDLNAWIEADINSIFKTPFTLGSKEFISTHADEINDLKHKIKVVNFTSAGLELRTALNLETNEEYNTKFIEWLKEKWGFSFALD
jgi:hypothetical protein